MTGEASPYVGQILDVAFSSAQAIVVLLTPDEIAYLRNEYWASPTDTDRHAAPQARPNVLFEAGMAMGRDTRRTILVEFGSVRPFSDIAGRHLLRLDNTVERRNDLVVRLRNAGCDVDTAGTDWLTAGDLTPPSPPGNGLPLGKRLPEPGTTTARIKFDLQYQDRGSSNGRLQIINRGTESAFNVTIELPYEAAVHVETSDLPVRELPSGKTVTLLAFRTGRKSHTTIRVTAEDAEGHQVSDDVFVNLG